MMMSKILAAFVTSGGLATLVSAQIIFNIETNNFDCPDTGGRYCAAASLSSNIIVRCAGFLGDPEDCRNQLFGVPPLGVKDFAPCYQLDRTIGDAACTLNGIVYPVDGEPFPIPGDLGLEKTPPAAGTIANVSTVASPKFANKTLHLESPGIIGSVKSAASASSGPGDLGLEKIPLAAGTIANVSTVASPKFANKTLHLESPSITGSIKSAASASLGPKTSARQAVQGIGPPERPVAPAVLGEVIPDFELLRHSIAPPHISTTSASSGPTIHARQVDQGIGPPERPVAPAVLGDMIPDFELLRHNIAPPHKSTTSAFSGPNIHARQVDQGIGPPEYPVAPIVQGEVSTVFRHSTVYPTKTTTITLSETVPSISPISQPVIVKTVTVSLQCVVSQNVTVSQGVLKSSVPVTVNGGMRVLAKSNDTSNIIFEYGIDGTGNSLSFQNSVPAVSTSSSSSVQGQSALNYTITPTSANLSTKINGTGSIIHTAAVLEMYIGAANILEMGFFAVAAGLLAVACLMLAN